MFLCEYRGVFTHIVCVCVYRCLCVSMCFYVVPLSEGIWLYVCVTVNVYV